MNRYANAYVPAWASQKPSLRRPPFPPSVVRPSRLGQVAEAPSRFLTWDNLDVQNHLVMQGMAALYSFLALPFYGKNKTFDRILLGGGAVAFGAAAFTGFKLGLDRMPTKRLVDYLFGITTGVLNGLIALGAAAAAVNPKLPTKTAPEAIRDSLPI